MQYKLLILAIPFALGACMSQSKIQTRYVEEQNGCQSYAETSIDKYTAGKKLSPKDRNAELVTLFSDCMGKQGWQVAKPARAKTAVSATANGPDMGRIMQTPTAVHKAAPVAPAQAVPTQPTALTPSPAQAPLSNSVPPGAATYQPARDLPASANPYGTGAGRQF